MEVRTWYMCDMFNGRAQSFITEKCSVVTPCTVASLPLLTLAITSDRRNPFCRVDSSPGVKIDPSLIVTAHGFVCFFRSSCGERQWAVSRAGRRERGGGEYTYQ
jgi:hypothetical protein